MPCSRCGSDNPEGSAFCAKCGIALAPPAQGSAPSPAGDPAAPPRKTSGKAVASLVLGVFSMMGCVAVAGIPGLILGILGYRKVRRERDRLVGEGLALAGIITSGLGTLNTLTILILAAIAIPNFMEAQVRSNVARTKTDQRSVATGIESFYVDRGIYPPGRPLREFTADTEALDAAGGLDLGAPNPGPGSMGLGITTPVPYVRSLPDDPFAPAPGLPFAYYADGNGGWILFSAGPDGVYDIDPSADYDSRERVPSSSLIHKTYDPTNGTTSGGDIWRVGGSG